MFKIKNALGNMSESSEFRFENSLKRHLEEMIIWEHCVVKFHSIEIPNFLLTLLKLIFIIDLIR